MKRRELFSSLGQMSGTVCQADTRRMAKLIPNAPFRNQNGRQVRFYEDLIKGRQVIVMMMYANCATFCPVATQRMVELHHREFAHRMGKDLFMVSVSLKPEEDDPAALEAYARMHGALLPGWTFLTGSRYDVDTLRYALFSHDHIGIDVNEDLHAGSMKVINDPIGRWVHANAFASTRTLLDRIRWMDPPKSLAQRLQDNRRLQQQIDREIAVYGYRKVV